MKEVDATIELLKRTFPGSSFNPIENVWIKVVEEKYPNIPENLKYLYRNLGYGTVGDSFYSIHMLLEPDDIYDPETSKQLKGKYIVGDNFCGDCHAYDAENNWTFGYIDCNGNFNELTEFYADFIEFLKQLALNENQME